MCIYIEIFLDIDIDDMYVCRFILYGIHISYARIS